ncbi:SAM-dependent methyltransferase [Vibrio maritimus]|uniref:SAM-dependent methyltransferase n=1 Tax=Vibrio maritimus TaxID=990268 RepID=A0A090U423_9VIBR|nr:SAM-dependent methyltransferase [Vibrio maritimus]
MHWDWAVDSDDQGYGLTEQRAKEILSKAGFAQVEVSIPFEIDAGKGPKKVLMGIGRK